MRAFFAVVFSVVVSASAISQSFDFECQALGALPNDASLSCDGVVSNNRDINSGVKSASTCAFPVSGSKYLALFASGPVTAPAGGPLARPVSANATELRIPVPAGSTLISLSWDFFNAEGGPQANYNDGMSIDIVDPSGAIVGNLAYADTNSALAGSACGIAGEIAPAGPKTLYAALPGMIPCCYLSIAVWNGGDNTLPSRLLIDNVVFDSSLPACPVPCLTVAGIPALVASSPSGIAGSILVSMSSLPPGGTYLLAATLTAGAYPNGWFYGIDIPVSELGILINAGAPFSGPISTAGCTSGEASIGPIFGAPSALTLYMVALAVPAGSLAGSPSAVTNAVSYTIP
jgi:hypothetical protein